MWCRRTPRVVGRWWLLSVALFAVVLQTGETTVAAQAGRFPALVPMPGLSARGVAIDKSGNVYVSVGQGTGSSEHILLWKFTPAGQPSFVADFGQGTIGGLMVTADGDLYLALAAGLDRGVWRMDRDGQIELVPSSDEIFFANGLAFDDVGTLYVTESVSRGPTGLGQGGLWRIPRGGVAELCLRDPLLTGNGRLGQPVPIGANGIAYYHGSLYITNTEEGTVLRIPLWPDGSVGTPELWTTLAEVPESPLAGAPLPVAGDGIALDVHGNLYVAVLTRSAVVRIDAQTLAQETLAAFQVVPHGSVPNAPFDFPASLFFGTGAGERTSLFVSNLGLGRVAVPPLPWPGPGLVKIDAGVPGRPLH